MNKNELIRNYQAQIDELRPVLTKGLADLFQRSVMLSEQIEETTNIAQTLSATEFPKIALLFQSGTQPETISHLILFPSEFVLSAYAWMIGEDPAAEVDESHLDGLKEIFNQMLGQIRMAIPDDQSRFTIENLQAGLIEKAEDAIPGDETYHGVKAKIKINCENQDFFVEHFAWSERWHIDEEETHSETIEPETVGKVNVEPAEFGGLGGNGQAYGGTNTRNIEMLLDVDLEITVELDRKSMLVSDLLKLGKGSIIEFPKSAGEPLDILVNGRKFAEGEVVVIDDKFGVRITQLLSPKERLKKLA